MQNVYPKVERTVTALTSTLERLDQAQHRWIAKNKDSFLIVLAFTINQNKNILVLYLQGNKIFSFSENIFQALYYSLKNAFHANCNGMPLSYKHVQAISF